MFVIRKCVQEICGNRFAMREKMAMSQYEASLTAEVNGLTLHYAKVGHGRPVILLHGNGEDHHLLETQIRQLSEAGYCVYALDSRGHGANEPLTEVHFDDMAEDVFAFIQALHLNKPALYGHSDGGIIALLLELRHPGTLGVMAISGTNLSPDGLSAAFIEEYSELNKKTPDPLITLMLTEPHIDPLLLRTIRIPVLVTAGENDLILPEETERIAAELPNSTKVIVSGADHGSYTRLRSSITRNSYRRILNGCWRAFLQTTAFPAPTQRSVTSLTV